MPPPDGRRQDAWAPADAACSPRAASHAPPLAPNSASSAAGALPSPPGPRPCPQPVPSLFPHASFPQADEAAARLKSPTTAVAADNLLSLILSAAPHRPSERREGLQDREWGENGSTSEDQSVPAPHSEASKKRPADEVAAQDTDKKTADAVDRPTAKRRYKKPTSLSAECVAEKKELLEEELCQLRDTLARLRRASGIPDWFFQQKEQLARKSLENLLLRDAMRQHDMYLANASRLLLAEYMSIHTESPVETFIHLTSDLTLRRRTLMGLKDTKLAQADKFITDSVWFTHPTKYWCQDSKYEADNGDFCAVKMDNTPFRGVRSVRQVFDALQFFFHHMEISISEVLGDITVREDDDSPDNSLSNHRLVSVMSHGVKVEKNIVKFFKYVEPPNGSAPYALVATDAVDVDELYPYLPEERVRMDINAAMKFTEHFVKKPKRSRSPLTSGADTDFNGTRRGSHGDRNDEEDELERVVVLTRFYRAKLHHSEIDMPAYVLQEVRQGLACFTDTMVKTMHRMIYETERSEF